MSTEIWLLVYTFAVYRLSELVSKDLIFDTVRRGAAKRAAAGGKVWKAIADWIHCSFCIGIWLSLPAAFIYCSVILHLVDFIDTLLLWFGMAGAQYFLSNMNFDRDSN